jgi:alkyl hydroperoxide reductase subunit AhpC
MSELGELEKRHEDFQRRHVRVVVISNDKPETARATQKDFPHLVVVADAEQNMARALEVLHMRAGPQGSTTNAPTTFVVDGAGSVRWMFRPERVLVRLSPDELLATIDAAGPLDGATSAR